MNQKLSDWASIAEIISAIAVAVTLIVLILGVQENTQVLRASAYANSVDSINDFGALISSDADALRVWVAYVAEEADDLDELESARLENYLLILFRIYEKAYFSKQYGLIGEQEWERFDRNICAQLEHVRAAGRVSLLEGVLTREFFAYIAGLCSD